MLPPVTERCPAVTGEKLYTRLLYSGVNNLNVNPGHRDCHSLPVALPVPELRRPANRGRSPNTSHVRRPMRLLLPGATRCETSASKAASPGESELWGGGCREAHVEP